MEKTGDLRWGIVAVNLRNEGFREIDAHREHSQYIKVRSTSIISIGRRTGRCQAMLTLPSVHLVTVTVTEWIRTRITLFEYLACGLRNRKDPITILCCDNIRQMVVLETQFLAYLYQTNQHESLDWVRMR